MNKTLISIALAAIATGGFFNIAAAQSPTGTLSVAPDAKAEVEALRQQLAAQKALNEQLRHRVAELEHELGTDARGATSPGALDRTATRMPVEPDPAQPSTAIEEALVSKGLVLLPSGSFRVTPEFAWDHSGAGASTHDGYALGLSLEAGLPWDLAATVSIPYLWARDNTWGNNEGTGDLSIALSKKLTRETDVMPSLVAHLRYTHDTGADVYAPVPIGNGYRSWRAELAAVKRFDPVVVYGNVSYRYSEPATVDFASFQGRVTPGASVGIGAGISLAATPAIALDAGLAFYFVAPTTYEPIGIGSYNDARQTIGYLTLGASFKLAKDLSLIVNAYPGVTRDASDLVLSVSLPYRF